MEKKMRGRIGKIRRWKNRGIAPRAKKRMI
jgi:hypothetical protein